MSIKIYQDSGDFLQIDVQLLEGFDKSHTQNKFLLHLCSIGVGCWGNDLLLANFPDSREALWVPHL